MPDVSLSSKLLLNTLSIRVKDCSVNLVGDVIFGKNPTVIKLSKKSLKCSFVLSLTNQCYNLHKYTKIDLIALPYGKIMQILLRLK